MAVFEQENEEQYPSLNNAIRNGMVPIDDAVNRLMCAMNSNTAKRKKRNRKIIFIVADQ